MENKKVLVPAKLTAENGAKAALMGEFHENVIMGCSDCDGEGFIDGEPCEDCGGVGEYTTSFPVSWTMIKAIWEKAVSVVGEPYETVIAESSDMTTQYKTANEVPTATIAARLEELSDCLLKRDKDAMDREFTIRIPAELDRDPDLVLSIAATRLLEYEAMLEALMKECWAVLGAFNHDQPYRVKQWLKPTAERIQYALNNGGHPPPNPTSEFKQQTGFDMPEILKGEQK